MRNTNASYVLALALLLLGACGARPDDPRAPRLVRTLRSGDTQQREAAAHALRGLGARGFTALRPLLGDPDPEVRRRAVFVWNTYAAASLRHVAQATTLMRDSDWVVRRESARVLARAAPTSEAAQQALLAVACSSRPEQHPTVIEAVARGLGASSGSQRTRAEPCLLALASHGVATVRAAAISALGELGSIRPATRAALQSAMQDDGSPLVRMRAALAFWRITGEARDALARLRSGLLSSRPGVPDAALAGLRSLGTHAGPAVPTLVTLLDDPSLRVRAAETLGALGPVAEAALPRLIAATRDRSAWFREAAERAVRSIRGS